MGIVNAVFKHAIKTTACPECEAAPGEKCEDMGTLHTQRLDAYIERLGGVPALKKRIEACGPRRNQ